MSTDNRIDYDSGVGFRLLEALASVAIVFFLFSLLTTAVHRAKDKQRRMQCANNLKQISVALQQHHDLHGHFPAAMGVAFGADRNDDHTNRLSGVVALLPFIEREELWEQIRTPTRIDNNTGGDTIPLPWDPSYPPWQVHLPPFQCPSAEWYESQLAPKSYAFSIGDMARQIHEPTVTRGAFACRRTTTLDDIIDGQSHTIALVDMRGEPFRINQPASILENPSITLSVDVSKGTERRGGRWADGAAGYNLVNTILPPNSPSCAVGADEMADGIYSAGSNHPGGVNALMADGAVRVINYDIDVGDSSAPTPTVEQMARDDFPSPYGVWGALGTARGGEATHEW